MIGLAVYMRCPPLCECGSGLPKQLREPQPWPRDTEQCTRCDEGDDQMEKDSWFDDWSSHQFGV